MRLVDLSERTSEDLARSAAIRPDPPLSQERDKQTNQSASQPGPKKVFKNERTQLYLKDN